MSAPVATPAELAELAALRRQVADLEGQLAALQVVNGDLQDSLTSCRTNVEAQQDEHAAYRLLHPPRREAP